MWTQSLFGKRIALQMPIIEIIRTNTSVAAYMHILIISYELIIHQLTYDIFFMKGIVYIHIKYICLFNSFALLFFIKEMLHFQSVIIVKNIIIHFLYKEILNHSNVNSGSFLNSSLYILVYTCKLHTTEIRNF